VEVFVKSNVSDYNIIAVYLESSGVVNVSTFFHYKYDFQCHVELQLYTLQFFLLTKSMLKFFSSNPMLLWFHWKSAYT
jgi:hypothetical protein